MINIFRKVFKVVFRSSSFNLFKQKKNGLGSNIKLSMLIVALMTVMVSCGPNNDELDAVKEFGNNKASEQTYCTELKTEGTDETEEPEKTVTRKPLLTPMPEMEATDPDSTPFMTKMLELITQPVIREKEPEPVQADSVAEQTAAEVIQADPVTEAQAAEPIGSHVYIASSGNGKKYHSNPSCSNMNGTIELTLEEAEAQGYTPCKKCY